MPEITYREAVRDALGAALRADDDVFVMGEDIAEMGGSMGVTHGLLDEFGPERVRNTPISEIAIVGAGIGAAMQGMRPVVEIMYEDFLTLSMEQIVNQAAKHRYMSGGQLKVPLTIRTQGGAGWSPGAQHAQQFEGWLCHVPGLKVVFPSTPEDARGLLWSSIYDDNPVVFFEHRLLYPVKGDVPETLEPIPLGKARIVREGTDVTVIATGPLVHHSLKAAEEAEAEGISVEVVDPRTLQPLDEETLIASVKKTNRAVVAHEAVRRMGFGAEVAAVLQEQAFDWLDAPVERVGSKFAPLAFAPAMEQYVVPQTGGRARGDQEDGRRDGYRGQAAAARAGHGGRDDRQVAEGGRRPRRAGRAALRARHRQGHAGGRVRGRRRPAPDRGAGGRGSRRTDDRGDRRSRRGRRGRPAAARRTLQRDCGRACRRGESAVPRLQPVAPLRHPRMATGSRPRRSRAGWPASAGSSSASLTGTGPDGRIVAEDVERAAAGVTRRARAPASERAGHSSRRRRVGPAHTIRKTIARRLTAAWEVPVFVLTVSVDMGPANALIERSRKRNPDVRVTVTDLLAKVCAQALMRHSDVNVQFTDDAILRFPSANIGIAVAAPQGLVVPVIHSAERLSLVETARRRIEVIGARARRASFARKISRAGRSRSRTSACTASSSSSRS